MGMTGGLSTQVKVNVKPIGVFKSGLIRQVVFEHRGLKIQGLYCNAFIKLRASNQMDTLTCMMEPLTNLIYHFSAW